MTVSAGVVAAATLALFSAEESSTSRGTLVTTFIAKPVLLPLAACDP